MKLFTWERDYYTVSYTTDPPLTGTVEASFDGGETWLAGTPSEGNWAWLVAGPDYDADAVGENPDDTQVTVTKRIVPKLRLADDPVLDAAHGPAIDLK